MRVKDVIAEDFLNYKEPAMFITTAMCDWKCCKECGVDNVCQNKELAHTPTKDVPDELLYDLFRSNNITKAVVIGGLEPMLQFEEVLNLIKLFRNSKCNCTFVIYTGYYEQEISEMIDQLRPEKNIIVKFGRYVPYTKSRFDDVLGVSLASDNQYAVSL